MKTEMKETKCIYYENGWCDLVRGARCLHYGKSNDCSFRRNEYKTGLARFVGRHGLDWREKHEFK